MAGFNIFNLAQENHIVIWPENQMAFDTFTRLMTQWRVGGMGGPTGLDYTAVLAFIRTLRLSRERADELFSDVQVMEAQALAALNEKTD